jgi:hypothetical protein
MEMRKKRILDHLQTAIGDLFFTLDCDRKRRTQNHPAKNTGLQLTEMPPRQTLIQILSA